jgi:hypothetical protein
MKVCVPEGATLAWEYTARNINAGIAILTPHRTSRFIRPAVLKVARALNENQSG